MGRWGIAGVALFLSACMTGAAPVVAAPSHPTEAPARPSPLGPAMDALLASPYCELDACVDPFPFFLARRWDARGGRVAFAGPGAIVGVYRDGAWDLGALPGGSLAHDVAFARDSTLFALAADGLFRRDGDAWTLVAESDGAGSWSALLVRSTDEIWIGTTDGTILRLSGEVATPIEPGPLMHGIDAMWESSGLVAAQGPFGGALFDGRSWHVSVTPEDFDNFDAASGCGWFGLAETLFPDADIYPPEGSEADAFEPVIPRTPPLPERPDRAPVGWVARLSPERRARVEPWLARAPLDVADFERVGSSWVAVGRSEAGSTLWGRIDGELVARALPLEHPRSVALAGTRVLVGDASGAIAILDGPGETPEVRDAGEGAPLVDTHGRADGTALAVAANGDVLSFDTAGMPRRLHRIGRPMRAIAGDARAWIAVGDGGVIVRGAGEEASRVDTGSTVDLFAVELRGERAVAVGAAGTLVRIAGQTATVAPRATYEALIDVHTEGDASFALGATGSVVRVEAGTWSRRRRDLRRDTTSRRLFSWVPTPDGDWAPIAEELDVLLDEEGAVMPYAMVGRVRPRTYFYGRPGDESSPLAVSLEGGLQHELQNTGMMCCEGAGDDYLEASLDDAAECVREPWRGSCRLVPEPVFAVDESAGTFLRAAAVGARDAAFCTPLRFEVVRLEGGVVERASPVFSCEGGREALGRAAWTFLSEAEQQSFARWDPLEQHELGGPSGAGLFVHRTAASDLLVFVSSDNRTATPFVTLRRPAGAAPRSEGWGRVDQLRASEGRRLLAVSAQIVGPTASDPFVWVGPAPRRPRAGDRRAEELEGARCDDLVVADADGETNVRSLPTASAELVGVLPNGTPFRASSRHRRWVRLLAPVSGWVFESNLRCDE